MTWIIHQKGVPLDENKIVIDTDDDGKLYLEWSSNREGGGVKRLYQDNFEGNAVTVLTEPTLTAKSRIVKGRLIGDPQEDETITFGDLVGIVGTTEFLGIAAGIGDIVEWVNNGNIELTGADSCVDNEDGSFTLTYPSGTAANAIINSTTSPALVLEEFAENGDPCDIQVVGGPKFTYRGISGFKSQYNEDGFPTSDFSRSLTWIGGTVWYWLNDSGGPQDSSLDDVLFPYQAVWAEDSVMTAIPMGGERSGRFSDDFADKPKYTRVEDADGSLYDLINPASYYNSQGWERVQTKIRRMVTVGVGSTTDSPTVINELAVPGLLADHVYKITIFIVVRAHHSSDEWAVGFTDSDMFSNTTGTGRQLTTDDFAEANHEYTITPGANLIGGMGDKNGVFTTIARLERDGDFGMQVVKSTTSDALEITVWPYSYVEIEDITP